MQKFLNLLATNNRQLIATHSEIPMTSQAFHDTPGIHQYAAPSPGQMDISHSHGPGSAHVHITPPLLLLGVYGVLVVMTVVTVAVTLIPAEVLGSASVWVALAIAVFKAGLVVMYFMHLRWDSPFNGIVLIISLFFVALFIGIAVLDSKEYEKNFIPPSASVQP
jgi:cytochrome c oxidase subunit 4